MMNDWKTTKEPKKAIIIIIQWSPPILAVEGNGNGLRVDEDMFGGWNDGASDVKAEGDDVGDWLVNVETDNVSAASVVDGDAVA